MISSFAALAGSMFLRLVEPEVEVVLLLTLAPLRAALPGVEGTEPFPLALFLMAKLPALPPGDLAIWRIRTRRSVIARGVGLSLGSVPAIQVEIRISGFVIVWKGRTYTPCFSDLLSVYREVMRLQNLEKQLLSVSFGQIEIV